MYVYTHLKWGFKVEDHGLKDKLHTIHFNKAFMKFYDTELNAKVAYARHAISIEENRRDFARVAWSSPRGASKDANGIQWFEQVWFSGNHSDIGGSYAENESRLSDIALDWMTRWALAVPDGVKFDRRVLRVWPHPEGAQHDEVAAGFASVPRRTGIWTEKHRELPGEGAIMHANVYRRRFDGESVRLTDTFGRYRPPTLRVHEDFKRFYGAHLAANSYDGQKHWLVSRRRFRSPCLQ